MSSTDRDALLGRFFHDHLLPASRAMQERRALLLEGGPDPDAESYWHARSDGGDALSGLDFDHLEDALRTLWEREDLSELARLAGALVELARAVEEEPDRAGEVDSFIYQMF